MHATCRLADGRIIDSTIRREPLRLRVGDINAILPDISASLIGMREGEEKTIRIPADRALNLYPGEISALFEGQDVFLTIRILQILTRNRSRALELLDAGASLQRKGEIDEAIRLYRDAIEWDPLSFQAFNNLGTALRQKGNFFEAIESYKAALRIKPDFAAAMHNLGTALRDAGEIEESIRWFRRAIRVQPDFVEAHGNLSFALLLAGNFEEGWEEYEWIWRLKQPSARLPQPRWNGEDIRGKSILLYAEQGFGDVIQFARYAPLVADRGANVIIGCQRELKRLLSSLDGIKAVIAFGERVPEFEYHCPLPSLPRIFRTTVESIPRRVPYLSVSDQLREAWRERVGRASSTYKVGLAWAGSPGHLNDLNRSCRPDLFLSISRISGLQLFSLQKDVPSRWERSRDTFPLIDLMAEVGDFSDTAALIMNLDLVISVDTAVAHLAGALGKPVWTLIPYAPDWRWMLNREDSPWYPTMRLFRQPAPGDWQSVIRCVSKELEKIVSKT